MISKAYSWRTMTAYDVPDIDQIAARVHPGFFEDTAVLAERQRLYTHGCHLLEIAEKPAGYVLSHPWLLGQLPPLNSFLGSIPDEADTYYIHDLALLPVTRRIGAAREIVAALTKHAEARDFATMSLVAVNASQSFWERQGFEVLDIPALRQKLSTYEASARFMIKTLG